MTTSTPAPPRLRLGSQDLIRLAGYAYAHGWELESFRLADSALDELDAAAQRDRSADMIRILHTWGAAELDAAMVTDFDGIYVTGVRLTGPGGQAVISRGGSIEGPSAPGAARLLTAARDALRLA